MQANSKPLFFIILAFILVLAISFLGNSFTVFGIQFKNINIINDLVKKEETDTIAVPAASQRGEPHKNLPDEYLTSENIQGYEETRTLDAFIRALHELKAGKRKKVRIAYFGDSMIEGDLICQDLRTYLQEYFGGSGVGFVPVTSVVAGFRQSIGHAYSENWKDEHFLNSNRASSKDLFLSGHLFRPGSHSVVSYQVPSYHRNSFFEECYLLYGLHDSATRIEVNDSAMYLVDNERLNKQLVSANTKRISAAFSGSGNVFYGFSFESSRGIFVDNLAFRGISGIELARITPEMLQETERVLPYDLIILQYGPNLLFKPDLVDFGWYEKPLKKVVEGFRSHFPGASILIIGAADKACRYDGEYRTQKGVLPLIHIQHKVAADTRVNFWNLYNSMGGRNSMLRWVAEKPPLANLDYTHLTHKGARVIAKQLFDQIMQVYDPDAASRSQIQPIVRYVSASRTM